MDEEHGVRLPFIYVGEGRFSNERQQRKVDSKTGKENVTYLYDIPMKEELPEYLQYDFGVAIGVRGTVLSYNYLIDERGTIYEDCKSSSGGAPLR